MDNNSFFLYVSPPGGGSRSVDHEPYPSACRSFFFVSLIIMVFNYSVSVSPVPRVPSAHPPSHISPVLATFHRALFVLLVPLLLLPSRPARPLSGAAQEQVAMCAVRGKFGLGLSPTVAVGSRLEEAVRDWRELESLCRACRGLPFLLSVRVREDTRKASQIFYLIAGHVHHHQHV